MSTTRILGSRVSSPKGITLAGHIALIERSIANEIAEARKSWPARCECEHPEPTHTTPEPEFAWCRCGGYVRVLPVNRP